MENEFYKVLVIIGWIISIALFIGMVRLINSGVTQAETAECGTWKSQAEQFPKFYLVGWQKAQCDHYHITINAPVID